MLKSRLKYKDEKNKVMQLLVKLKKSSLLGQQMRKDIEEKYA